MGTTLSVYDQLKSDTNECLSVIRREIGMKTTCKPFAEKLRSALADLENQTEQENLRAANVLLAGLQTLMQGGITAEDYDKVDFVKRGKTIVPSARVEAFFRAAARKGYRITDTIVAVPKEDANTTYFKEMLLQSGEIAYILEDKRLNPDRAMTAERLISGYFSKVICRLEVRDVSRNQRVAMTVCEMPTAEILAAAASGEQGLYKSEWVYNPQKRKKEKVITNELNTNTFWVKWTGEMVNKTVIRRALKRVREVLPELKESIYAFEHDEYIETPAAQIQPVDVIDIPLAGESPADVDFKNLTPEQDEEYRETVSLWIANPKLAEDKLAEIKAMIESGESAQQIVNKEYASIAALKRSKKKWAEIGGFFDEKDKA